MLSYFTQTGKIKFNVPQNDSYYSIISKISWNADMLLALEYQGNPATSGDSLPIKALK